MSSKSLNKVMLIGYVGRDIETRYTAEGIAVTNFSVATNEYQGEGKPERTEWHTIVAWRRLAEICGEYLETGRQVYIEGRNQTRSWEDDKTGQKRSKTEVIARDVILLGGKGKAPEVVITQVSGSSAEIRPADPGPADEDIPF